MLPVYINNFNRLIYLKNVLREFQRFNEATPIMIHIVDNGSTLPELHEWYDSEASNTYPFPIKIIRQNNRGPRGWFGIMEHVNPHYIVCDPDIDFSPCPTDLFEMLIKGLVDYPEMMKTGPSIRISDIPKEHPFHPHIHGIEGRFYEKRHSEQWWHAELDTTCIACRTGQHFAYGPALRAAAPYEVRHLPYYYLPGQLTREEIYYFENLPLEFKHGIYWSTLMTDSKVYEIQKGEPDATA